MLVEMTVFGKSGSREPKMLLMAKGVKYCGPGVFVITVQRVRNPGIRTG
jgi:hypothetical protein